MQTTTTVKKYKWSHRFHEYDIHFGNLLALVIWVPDAALTPERRSARQFGCKISRPNWRPEGGCGSGGQPDPRYKVSTVRPFKLFFAILADFLALGSVGREVPEVLKKVLKNRSFGGEAAGEASLDQ